MSHLSDLNNNTGHTDRKSPAHFLFLHRALQLSAADGTETLLIKAQCLSDTHTSIYSASRWCINLHFRQINPYDCFSRVTHVLIFRIDISRHLDLQKMFLLLLFFLSLFTEFSCCVSKTRSVSSCCLSSFGRRVLVSRMRSQSGRFRVACTWVCYLLFELKTLWSDCFTLLLLLQILYRS